MGWDLKTRSFRNCIRHLKKFREVGGKKEIAYGDLTITIFFPQQWVVEIDGRFIARLVCIVRELQLYLSGCRRYGKLLNKGLICFHSEDTLAVLSTELLYTTICLEPWADDATSIRGSKETSRFQQISSSPKGLNKFLSSKPFQQLCCVNNVSMAKYFGVQQ